MPQPAARRRALELAADHAVRTPSVHDSRPWRIELRPDDRLLVRADRSPRVTVLDPRGRQLVLSAGAALFDVRVALAGAGWSAEIERLPSPDDPDLLAAVRPGPGAPDRALAALAAAARRRRAYRRRVTGAALPRVVLRRLAEIAESEDALLVPVVDDAHRLLVERLTQQADGLEGPDGGPSGTHADLHRTMLLLATRTDDPIAWLRAGEALQHLVLELTRLGWRASPLTQAIEVPLTRTRLRSALTWHAHPQMLLRVGEAPAADDAGGLAHRTTLRDRGPGPMRPETLGRGLLRS